MAKRLEMAARENFVAFGTQQLRSDLNHRDLVIHDEDFSHAAMVWKRARSGK